MITEMQFSHIDQVAEIHSRSLPDDFLTSIGMTFLKGVFYRGLLESPAGFGYVDMQDGQVRGFVTGSYKSEKTYKEIICRRWGLFFLCLVWSTLRRPSIFKKIVQTAHFIVKQKAASPSAQLISIAVKEDFRRQNIGTRLIQALKDNFGASGSKEFSVITDSHLQDSNRLYQKNGFKLDRTFSIYGKKRNVYLYQREK